MFSSFKAISLSHKNAPLAIREQVALDENAGRSLLRHLKGLPGLTDMMILSTCNRTEIYYCSPADQTEEILQALFEQKQILVTKGFNYQDYFTIFNDPDAAMQHLFRVAAGLESKEIGDGQIYHQVKRAYEYAVQEGLAGTFLHRLMHTVFFAHKRIVQETPFSEGVISLSRAAVELAELITAKVTEPRILVIGIGEIGSEVCRYLSELPYKKVQLTNRTYAKTEPIASKYGYQAVPFEQVFEAIEEADIIISSVCKEHPLINQDCIRSKERVRHQYFIDLSVPRSVEPSLEELSGIVVYNIDELYQQTSYAKVKRLQAIPQVENIILEAITQFKEWANEQVMSPMIGQLKTMLEAIRQEEMARYARKMNDTELKLIDELTRSLTQKFLKMPVLQLKAACKRGESDLLLKGLTDLFGLNIQEQVEQD